MLLPKIFTREELQRPLIISPGSQEEGECPHIRACSVIRSNAVIIIFFFVQPLPLNLFNYGIFAAGTIEREREKRVYWQLHELDYKHTR